MSLKNSRLVVCCGHGLRFLTFSNTKSLMLMLFLVPMLLGSSIVTRPAWSTQPKSDAPPESIENLPHLFYLGNLPQKPAPYLTEKPKGHLSKEDWQALIDTTWGPGASPFVQEFIFNRYWNTIDESFACFNGITDTWQQLYDQHIDEVSTGISKGRFQALLSKMSMSLMETHTYVINLDFWSTMAEPGVPLMVCGSAGRMAGRFGAAVTALPDGRGLVFRVIPDHPLGLAPGDIILGYDGIPWTDLYLELLDAELPVVGSWGSSEASVAHIWQMSVGSNWHLFDTIDIQKFGTGEIQSRPTSLLVGLDTPISGVEQLDVGVRFPDPTIDNMVTWGFIEHDGLNIGYIYGWGWSGDAEEAFEEAVKGIMYDNQTDGLIVDFRFNGGGNMHMSNPALSHLFNESTPTIRFGYRCPGGEHTEMCTSGVTEPFNIPGDPESYYDRPIAVLTGPCVFSSGDQVALRMAMHPHARTFGKPTSSCFNNPQQMNVGVANWVGSFGSADASLVSDPDQYLTHVGLPVDEPVWLTPEDVAIGEDTVVNAAVAWIQGAVTSVTELDEESPQNSVPVVKQTALLGNYPNPFNPTTSIIYTLAHSGQGHLRIYDLAGRAVRSFSTVGQTAGRNSVVWDGRDDHGNAVGSGTYLVRLSDGDRVDSHRVTLVK